MKGKYRRKLLSVFLLASSLFIMVLVGNQIRYRALAATIISFSPVADARVEEGSPGTNFGTSTYLRSDKPAAQSYLRFDVSGVTGTIQQALLRLYVPSGYSTTNGPAVYGTDNQWEETLITWTNKPPPTTAASDNKGSILENQWVEYNVTPLVTGNGSVSFILIADSSDGVRFSSREATNKPQLVITLQGEPTSTPSPSPTIIPSSTPTISPTPTPTPTQSTSTPTPTPITGIINFTPVRFPENPLIRPNMLPGTDGKNINGPSLIKVPDWIPNKLGNYYLYFSHHSGKYIRLAYSDNLHGPWNIYIPGTLSVSQATVCGSHIASPDVHVDSIRQEIRMYFHCPIYGGTTQYTFVATSSDGINFTHQTQRLGAPYFRVFEYESYYYAIGKGGSSSIIYRSTNPYNSFAKGKSILPSSRHTAVYLNGNIAYIFYSRIGDAPERILLSTMDISGDWSTWTPSVPIEILRPEYDYEGANLPIAPSKGGKTSGPVHQLRDPGIYEEAGKLYLLYSVAGEQGIGAAELIMQ